MKYTTLLFFSFLYLFIFFSCGDENFESYPNHEFDNHKGLLPSEYIQTKIDKKTGNKVVVTTSLKYDNFNRLISVKSAISDSITNTQIITYNESNGNVYTVTTENISGTYLYSYEYTKPGIILEHRSFKTNPPPGYPEIEPYTRTLTVSDNKLIKIDDPKEVKSSHCKYDKNGNLIQFDTNQYNYDILKGIMSNVKTPNWLFAAFEENLPFTYNLVNNIISDNKGIYYKYEYDKELHPNYPKKIIINNKEEIIIKYALTK
jgi:hypothetical protein